jgi:D-Tyr-tRNAtyr deacylase
MGPKHGPCSGAVQPPLRDRGTEAPALARVFGAMMDVELVNDGSVTLLIEI